MHIFKVLDKDYSLRFALAVSFCSVLSVLCRHRGPALSSTRYSKCMTVFLLHTLIHLSWQGL